MKVLFTLTSLFIASILAAPIAPEAREVAADGTPSMVSGGEVVEFDADNVTLEGRQIPDATPAMSNGAETVEFANGGVAARDVAGRQLPDATPAMSDGATVVEFGNGGNVA